jgi:hypothetical protein
MDVTAFDINGPDPGRKVKMNFHLFEREKPNFDPVQWLWEFRRASEKKNFPFPEIFDGWQ